MSCIKRGALIVVEGVDRSGKSTQCKNLVNSLNNLDIKARLMNFPDRTTLTGKLINQYLSDKQCTLNDRAIHLLFAANRWENVDKMKQLLYDGYTVIVDRYSYSGIVFSAVKNHMDIDWCKQPEVGLPLPDLVLLLTLPEEEINKRPGFGEERYENSVTQKKVSELFIKLAMEEKNWKIINAAGSIDSVQSVLLENVLKRREEVNMTPLESLHLSKRP